MKVKVRLELTLAKFRLHGEKEIEMELPEETQLFTLLEYLKIPNDEHKLIVKNGRVAFPQELLYDGDFIIILPSLEGG